MSKVIYPVCTIYRKYHYKYIFTTCFNVVDNNLNTYTKINYNKYQETFLSK